MELDETGFPQPTGEVEELEADSLILALGQETDLSFVEDVARIHSLTAWAFLALSLGAIWFLHQGGASASANRRSALLVGAILVPAGTENVKVNTPIALLEGGCLAPIAAYHDGLSLTAERGRRSTSERRSRPPQRVRGLQARGRPHDHDGFDGRMSAPQVGAAQCPGAGNFHLRVFLSWSVCSSYSGVRR